MDKSEKIVKLYLETSGATDIAFEPRGPSTCPDFSIGTNIGIEVRTLNQHYFGGDEAEGLEQLGITIDKRLRDVIDEMNEGLNLDYAVYIMARVHRPIELESRKLRKAILATFKGKSDFGCRSEEKVCKGLELRFIPVAESIYKGLVPGGRTDTSAGGWVSEYYPLNINECLRDKNQKVAKAIKDGADFDSWWLILVDGMGGFAPEDSKDIKAKIDPLGVFDRLTVLSYETGKMLIDFESNHSR